MEMQNWDLRNFTRGLIIKGNPHQLKINDTILILKPIQNFKFTESTIFNPIQKQDLSNDYQNAWPNIETYIRVMFNLTIENYFNPFRQHLKELFNNKLDPRDLYLYENVRIYPNYNFNDKSEIDLYVSFRIRAPNFIDDDDIIKPRKLKQINWEFTERLSKRNLLFFSFSPYMEKIEAVAISFAKKGTIQNNIVPISILQGKLEIDKEYYMFEPVQRWNNPICNLLLNSNKDTLPNNLIKQMIKLDYSENIVENKLNKPEEIRSFCNVDNDQFNSILYSLSHHLTLVNGAPGTGKTHLGCELVKYLLRFNYNYPIIVVTYKNVSLDGFLENIADFLKMNQIDFIRIGGKPRTENFFILSRCYLPSYSNELKQMKNQYKFLISLRIRLNYCLDNYQSPHKQDLIMMIINEIDKLINIRNIMFEKYSFYTRNESYIIANLLNPLEFIPSTNDYFNCWLYGPLYYDNIKEQLHQKYETYCSKLFQEFRSFLTRKDNYIMTDIIKVIINNYFSNQIDKFDSFLNEYKKNILKNDETVLKSIIKKRSRFYKLEDFTKSKTINLMESKYLDFVKEKFYRLLETGEDNDAMLKLFLEGFSNFLEKYIVDLEEMISDEQYIHKQNEISMLGRLLKTKKLIAMTATLAAEYKESLDQSNCQFMIIEEAGELTEPMTFSIIPKQIQHLLMIGDYRQLRPVVEYTLSFPPYNHHISLFEKLVIHSKKHKIGNLFTLSIQRRMHPQISSLLRKVFYNKNDNERLIDDESTKNLENPMGIPNHIQFWLHDFEEESEILKLRSHINKMEAKICAYLFLMMLCRGYKSNEITIISLYKGQKKQIERELMKLIDDYYDDEEMKIFDVFDFENDMPKYLDSKNNISFEKLIEYRKSLVGRYVKVLDDFQGEENEVIIISLTRSVKPGFVKNDNRALVTLSRAKQMEFVLGNRKVFGPSNSINPLWQIISKEANLIDVNTLNFDGIATCQCAVHSNDKKRIILKNIDDLYDYRFNYCDYECESNHICGHECHLPCHLHSLINQKNHQIFSRRYFCDENCSKLCKNGHKCKGNCGKCTHFGCLPCKNKCPNTCSLCSNQCSLSCSHQGKCQRKFSYREK